MVKFKKVMPILSLVLVLSLFTTSIFADNVKAVDAVDLDVIENAVESTIEPDAEEAESDVNTEFDLVDDIDNVDVEETDVDDVNLEEIEIGIDDGSAKIVDTKDIKNKEVILQNQCDIVDRFMTECNRTRSATATATNKVSLIAIHEDTICVGLEDVSDENFKAEVLALPGIQEELVEFIEFRIDWYGPRKLTEEEQGITPRGTYSMGSKIAIDGYGFTIGSPTSSKGDYFYTAHHGALSVGSKVKYGSTQIGAVDKFSFGSNTDISRVNVSSYGNIISTLVSTYKAAPPPKGTRVTAYTGYSGAISGDIIEPSATVSGPGGMTFRDVIVVNMSTQSGDSGAALVYKSSAIGILSFGASSGSTPVTVFTKPTNVSF